MNKNMLRVTMAWLFISACASCAICVFVFNSPFAKNTIDYLSFLAALFLIIDGFYKVSRYREEPYFPNQFIRQVRIIIGACVFTVHLLQYVYGI